MRVQAVAVGIVFLVIGLVFFLVPIDGQYTTGDYATSNAPVVFYEPGLTPGSLTFEVTWTTTSSVTVSVYNCGSDTGCSAGSAYEKSGDLVQSQTSNNGDITFTGSAGTGYEVYASSSTFVSVNYDGPLFGGFFGAGFAAFGLLILLIGLVVKPSRRGARGAGKAAAAPPTPMAVNYLAGAQSPGAPAPPPPPAPGGSSAPGLAGYSGPAYPGAPTDPNDPRRK